MTAADHDDRTAPDGTVTFLFTDLESSTRLWEEHPDAMKASLARHDGILRDAIVGNGGYVVKTTGDGFHAAFATAGDAVQAALDAQRELGGEDWGTPGSLRVRMGIHTGPAEQRDGDYFGPTLNRAARLMSAAHGGQVVVSLATEELARDALGPGVAVLDLGEHRLRDVTRPERVFQLLHPDLRPSFPPLNSLDAVRGNLPPQLSSFVGRETERAALVEALGEARLVTITGAGGVGKTRLALQVASELQPEVADGAWLCELAAAVDDASLGQIVARAVEAVPRPGLSLAQSIVEYLRGRSALVVLDNCEHLVDEAGTLAESILRECPGVRVLATSREGLAVPGERVWPLRSLPVPDLEASAETAIASASVRLFVDRAQAARPGFSLDAGNAAAVAEVCRRLDGIPLAVELAAARVVAMNPGEIAALLDERFRLLTGGRRSGVERHQTLRATVDWSYSLLSELERLVFERLGVFAGSFDAAAATDVITGDGVEAWDVLDAIGSLVAKSMLAADDADAGPTRYRLLETMRRYALDRLDERGEADRWRRRHAAHYAARSEEAARGLRGPDELAWRARVSADLDNIRAAVTWSLDSDRETDHELALRAIAAFAAEANTGASTFGVGAWAERALPAARATAKAGLRADVIAAAGWNAFVGGDLERAGALALEALGDGLSPEMRAPSIPFVLQGYIEVIYGHMDAAIEWTAKGRAALAELAGIDPYETVVMALSHTAFTSFGAVRGDLDATIGEVFRMARELGNPSALANALTIKVVTTWVNDPASAAPWLDEAIGLVRAGANGVMFGIMLAIRAHLSMNRGDLAAARAALREAVAYLGDTGDLPQIVTVLQYAIPALVASGANGPAAVVAGFSMEGPFAPLGNMPPDVEPRRDSAVARARAELGAEAFDAAWARGASMTLEEALAFALETLDAEE